MALPKYTSPIVGKFLKPLCTAYNEVVTSYHTNNAAELRTTVTKYQVETVRLWRGELTLLYYQDTFTQDNNLGLVKQVMSSQTRSNIRRLTRTFITPSLSDLALRVGLNSPALVEAELVKMIQSGSIQATISHQVVIRGFWLVSF